MQTREIVVENRHGLHLRVAGGVARCVAGHHSKVCLSRDGVTADGRSVLEMLMLEAPAGTRLHLRVDGPDEREVLARIAECFSDGAGI
jgi:phosphotransferase system HPr (HPr) family protein